ncbi:hypothetical protein D8674_020902 [Pyrus ussuriensis x Pyrus communis]|uniref:Uncharacterized protein n=1 Tax=Pyrus ussuriensis x Pyrus communis TaxID=2448454 RepID=A0A5N5HV95_9ROSA|nr:hypothetical protein D8674_020902 [Pyrus ussuriensis x Pyrus communis]
MDDKNKDESVRDTNLHDLREHFEFAHVICKYTLDDDTNEQLMKLMDDALEGGYNRWRYEVLWNGPGPSK